MLLGNLRKPSGAQASLQGRFPTRSKAPQLGVNGTGTWQDGLLIQSGERHAGLQAGDDAASGGVEGRRPSKFVVTEADA